MQYNKVAFLTEMGFQGKVPVDHPNMRTEFAWMHALDADHRPIHNYREVKDYDHVLIIFPKGKTFINAEGSKLVERVNPISELLLTDIVSTLKKYNKKVHYVQEGPHWFWNDYDLVDQINFYNFISECDSILAHNEHDFGYYKGMFPTKPVGVLDSLMIETLVKDINTVKEEKAIIGGNFARWYGGFQSFIVAQEFKVPVYGQSSHAKREGEEQLVNILPRMLWRDWIKTLSTFKYAVHLMPTVAAGTFSLNCAYLGIPCIGNREVTTQKLCHPNLSVDVWDVRRARELAQRLREDEDFYNDCSITAKHNYRSQYDINTWKARVNYALNEAK